LKFYIQLVMFMVGSINELRTLGILVGFKFGGSVLSFSILNHPNILCPFTIRKIPSIRSLVFL